MEEEQTSDWSIFKTDCTHEDEECVTAPTAIIPPSRLRIVARDIDQLLAKDAYAIAVELQLITRNSECIVSSDRVRARVYL